MKIEVNGEGREVDAATVEEALVALGWGDMRVATALNGEFVPATERAETPIRPGDQLEALTAMQGG